MIGMRVHVGRDRKECVGKSLRYDLMGIGKLAYPQDTLFRSRGIVAGIDLGGSHVQPPEPDGRVRRIKSHAAIVPQAERKTKPVYLL